MEKQERIELLEEAQRHVAEAIQCIESSMLGTGSRSGNYTYTMVLQALEIVKDSEHPYISREPNIQELIEQIEATEDDQPEPKEGGENDGEES